MAARKDESILFQVARRLRIDGNSLKRAEDLHRILQNKDSIKNISDNAKAVLCLDLATAELGTPFEKESAIKLAGVRKTVYQKYLNNVESILQLGKLPSISEICVKMSCTGIRSLAEDILDKYQLHHVLVDFKHPQYAAAAVYTACRLRSIKVQRSEFITLSKLPPHSWKELETEFSHFSEKNGFSTNKHRKKDQETSEDHYNEPDNRTKTAKEDIIEIEEYEVWKLRILAEAKTALKINQ